MNEPATKLSEEQIQRRRTDIRRGLTRVNWAVLAIVVVVIGLAVTGVLAAYRASGNAHEAQAATHQAQEELCRSYLAQASAGRLSGQMGRKAAGLRIIEAAARIHPSLELRTEAIAHLALTDVEESNEPERPGGWFDRDMKRYSVLGEGGTLRVRDLQRDADLFNCRDTNRNLRFLTFSGDGRYFVGGHAGSDLFVWDLASCKQIPVGAFSDEATSAQFSPDSSRLVYLSDERTLRFVEPAAGREIAPPLRLPESTFGFVFHSQAYQIAVRTETAVQLWDLETRQMLGTFEHNARITMIAWAGPYLAAGDDNGELQVWDLRTRRTQRWGAHKMLVSSLLFDHGGDMLVSGSYDMTCCIWDPHTKHLIASTKRGFGIAFSGADTEMIRVRGSSAGWTLGNWRVRRPPELRLIECADTPDDPNIFCADFSRDGRILAVMKADGLRLFDLASGKRFLFQPMQRGRTAHFLTDGKTLLTLGDFRYSLWPLLAGTNEAIPMRLGVPRHVTLPKTDHVDSGGVDLSGQKATVQLTDTEIALVDLQNPGGIQVFQKSAYPTSPALSPDGKWVVTGTFHGPGSFLWDAVTGKKMQQLASGNATPLFSPDGKTLLLAGDNQYTLLETDTWKALRHISTDNQGDLPGIAGYSHDGKILCLVKGRQQVQLLDAATCQVLATLTSPEPQIVSLFAFSPDDQVLAVGTGNDLVECWDLRQVRRSLAALGLDWDTSRPTAQPCPPPAGRWTGPGFSVSSPQFLGLTLAAVALVLFCAWVVLKRQRQLFGEYIEIDHLNEQQNRELTAAQAVVIHSQKMRALGTLAAGIAHDFNNILSVIRMSNKLIGREGKENPEIQEHVSEVEKAVQQGKNVVRSMLGYSREQGEANGHISLPDLVEDVVGLLSKQFLSGIALKLELDRAIPPVQGARARVEQILLNLIVNASEAMDGKGNLRINVKPIETPGQGLIRQPAAAPAYVEMSVADSGPGIDPQILPRIFEPFFTTKLLGTSRGTGLGLSTVDTIAEQDGLGIGVVTGTGTTFRIILPVDRDVPH
jgi:signal transduction histidine kinase